MPVTRIDALCACDGCGKRFGVELEIAEDLKDGDHPDFESLVRETIRGGQCNCYIWGVRGKTTVDRLPLSYEATIQGDYMLCDVCSRKCDMAPIKGNLSRTQVEKVLDMAQTVDG